MAPRAPSRPAGTGYIGLDQWLDLNRQQASGMADSLVSGINANGQKAEGALGQSVEQFYRDTDNSGLNYSEDGLYKGITQAPNELGDVGLANKRAADASKFEWKGPKTLDGYDLFKSGAAAAADNQRDANLATNQYGRQSLLQNQYGKGGGYSLGQQRLDSALVGAAGGDKLDGAKAQWGGLLGKFSKASTDAGAYSQQVQKNSADAVKQYQDKAAQMTAEYQRRAKPAGQGKQETDEAKAERKRQREEMRAEQKRNRTADRGGGSGGKADFDRWMASNWN